MKKTIISIFLSFFCFNSVSCQVYDNFELDMQNHMKYLSNSEDKSLIQFGFVIGLVGIGAVAMHKSNKNYRTKKWRNITYGLFAVSFSVVSAGVLSNEINRRKAKEIQFYY